MSQGAGAEPMQPAGTAIQGFPDLDNESLVRERSKAESRNSGAIDSRHGRIDSRSEVHRGRIIHIIHYGILHQGGGLEETELAAEVDDGMSGPCHFPDLLTEGVIRRRTQ